MEKTDTAIIIENIARVYETTTGVFRRKKIQVPALKDISFNIPSGEIFGIVGPNGAGKTTLIKILTTLLLPTSGTAYILGKDVTRNEKAIRRRINVVFGGERGLYTRLSARDNLKYFAALYEVPRKVAEQRIQHLLELVQLNGREDERVEGYSKGMKQRLHIAKSLLNDPEILFLDEPTIGLDPNAARMLHTIVKDLEALKKTIILTSHYMFEVDILCKQVAVINKGTLIVIDSPRNLKRYVSTSYVIEANILHGSLNEGIIDRLKEHPDAKTFSYTVRGKAQGLTIQTSNPEILTHEIRSLIPVTDIEYIITREPTLEDAYLKLVGEEK